MRLILANIDQVLRRGSRGLSRIKTKSQSSTRKRKIRVIRVNPRLLSRFQPASPPAPQCPSPLRDAPSPAPLHPFWPAAPDIPAARKSYPPAILHQAGFLRARQRLVPAQNTPRCAAGDHPLPAGREQKSPAFLQP